MSVYRTIGPLVSSSVHCLPKLVGLKIKDHYSSFAVPKGSVYFIKKCIGVPPQDFCHSKKGLVAILEPPWKLIR